MQKQTRLGKIKGNPLPDKVKIHLREGLFIMILAISTLLLLSLITYDPRDSVWSFSGSNDTFANIGGRAGAWFADIFLYAFGYFAYLFPFIVLYPFRRLFRKNPPSKSQEISISIMRYFGFILTVIGGCSIVNLELANMDANLPFTAGGIMGNSVANHLMLAFNQFGAVLFSLALLLTGMTFLTGISWIKIIETLAQVSMKYSCKSFAYFSRLKNKISTFLRDVYRKLKPTKKTTLIQRNPVNKKQKQPKVKKVELQPTLDDVQPNSSVGAIKTKKTPQQAKTPLFSTHAEGIPSLNLLDRAKRSGAYSGYSNTELESISNEVEQRLLDFGVKAQVVGIHPGPVITRFELQLAPGIKASKLTGLAKDIARSLSLSRVRIVEIIPGKPVVGLELPNKHREIVRLSEVLETEQYEKAHSQLSLALGVDIAGHPVIVDLAKMPHLLVAGTTGSGKSVGLNAMLLSLLFKATPNEVRLILVDPKMLELSVYDSIPHLLTPVVTDMKEAANALRWAVAEMERRYRLMAALKVRNVLNYNAKILEASNKGEDLTDPLWKSQNPDEQAPLLQTLPYVVIVIDELADMMMVVGKKVEQLIARISQKARASGIHLILATQRPSVDVLTGLIKSNVPTRISFQVSSKVDSRTILDQQGAEQLLGHGDMLYLVPGAGTPVRVHGAFVDDSEVQQVTDEWRRKGKPVYVDDILSDTQDSQGDFADSTQSGNLEDNDPLYDQAVAFVIETRKASISSVQRTLKIGYNRAARLIEEMERTGIVSAMESNGAREVLAPAPAER